MLQRAQIFPEVDATAGVTLQHGAGQVTTGTTGSGTGTGTGTTGTANATTTVYRLEGGISSWEIDLFGRLRSLSHSALDQYFATEAAGRETRLVLVAQVADAYLTLATDRSLLAIAIDTQNSAQTTVALTQARLNGGVAPRTDLRQAQTVLATAQADQARELTLVAQDRDALELLVGAPVPDASLPPSIEAIDGTLTELPAGLDSSVLLRRPDVVEAEYQLKAANAQIGAARAAFFPNITLTAAAGLASTALSSMFTGGAFTWTVAPSARLPIFDGGANRGNLAYARAQRDVYLAGYSKAIETAFREVADGLARRGTIDRELAADLLNLTAAQDTMTLDVARYREGIDPYLNVLDAQRTFYAARQTVAQMRLTKAENLVTLYQVLGGDQMADQPRAR